MTAHGIERVSLCLGSHVLVVVVLPLSAGVPDECRVVPPVYASPVMQHWEGGTETRGGAEKKRIKLTALSEPPTRLHETPTYLHMYNQDSGTLASSGDNISCGHSGRRPLSDPARDMECTPSPPVFVESAQQDLLHSPVDRFSILESSTELLRR